MSDLLSGVLVITISVLYSVSMLNIVILLFLMCALTATEQINSACLSSIVPDILKDTSIPNERFNGIVGSFHNFGDLAGPIVAGIIITLVGINIAFVIDGVSFLISSLILLIFIKIIPNKVQKNNETSKIDGLSEAFSFIFQNPKIRYVLVPSILVNLMVFPMVAIILPYMAKNNFSN